jgi:hypothetical protein
LCRDHLAISFYFRKDVQYLNLNGFPPVDFDPRKMTQYYLFGGQIIETHGLDYF